jgi:DNA/RNA-binding protein KIN17
MQLFRDEPGKYMDLYSVEFEEAYIEIIRRKRNARLKANAVYQELVSHRQHIHMNSTKWETLSSFLQYLGKKGIAVVDLTPKGWFIQYIDKDPERIRRQEAIARKEAAALDEEERTAKLIDLQMATAKQVEQQLGETTGDIEEAEEEGNEGDDNEGDEPAEKEEEKKRRQSRNGLQTDAYDCANHQKICFHD